ncbi:MAG: GNAT family N-acetyltransferase, partial [Myxococcota bacterium]
DGELERILLYYLGLSIPVAFWVGEDLSAHPEFFQAGRAIVPERHHFHVIGDQMSAVREHFNVTSCQKMHRMGLERANYVRRQGDPRVVRLGHRDTAAIMELYAHYPDHFFEPYQMESGLYFGVRDDDHLVSIAGVHVLNVEHDVAVIGNLVTHPDARGQGFATACTGRLLDELFERVSFVALNVQAQNTPAIRMYTNFGFGPNNIYFEGRVSDD